MPSAHEIVYHGSYVPLQGQKVSEAYASTVGLSFDVRSGLLMRQAHHWAADIFLGAIAVHMARVFFTGAFRKPREFNWIVGVTMLILGIVNGFLGYSLPDDLVSGTGIRIAYSIIESIPLVGTYLAFFLFGGNYPGSGVIIPRFFIIHVLIVPAILVGLLAAHLGLLVKQKHTQFPGKGKTEHNVVGSPMFPTFMAKTTGLPVHDRRRSSSCSAASPRSTRSGSSASTSRTRSPTPCNRTGTWAGWTARSGSCRVGSGWAGATPSRSRCSCRR